ncbi:MAG: hypothetical protein LJE74_08140 [Proteobacteria bacterium]|jgi:hypothetical protein|nr:hypothetical protein [Pseudomonadota bacterium]MCG6934412.1 hypothetical protein [Pseudomonadota bacterium]
MKMDRTIGSGKPRAGKAFRDNPDRLFQVKNVGWYVHAREGLKGPFTDKQDAEDLIVELISRQPADPSGYISTVEL